MKNILERLAMQPGAKEAQLRENSEGENPPTGAPAEGRRFPTLSKERSPRMRSAANGLSLMARTPEGVSEVLLNSLPEDSNEVFVIDAVTKARRTVGLETLRDLRLIRG
jgi:hypothetical protein